ncbi:bifunctional diguanylate cyclase/phosphodiesterase [Phenylobacterium sp.]|jgi:predicted signal transduction protein with EAL and GGDEF domain|uniref:putative bifunctional diguanylate cyclase/phosphodiesterase n=1 Tax=Phenylobacterium sp. TaxID=1871053 RepID=UPI002F42081C
MSKLWVYNTAARLPWVGYRAKLLGVSALGAAAPIALIAGASDGRISAPLLAAAAALAAAGLAGLAHLLRPISVAAGELRQCAEASDAPGRGRADEAGQLIADARHVAARLEALSFRLTHRHPVTRLPTREPFLATLAEDLAGAQGAAVLGVIRFADYDRLAAFDQAAADRVLHAFARRLEGAVDQGRPLAQVDRDCFAVWVSGVDDPQTAAAELQALSYVLGQEIDAADFKITPNVGLGAAIHPHDGADAPILLTRALAALPKSGQLAAGRLNFFSAESSTAARARFSLEQSLRQAISREELLLHFQPVVDLTAGRVVGAEALLRWRHPERGLVSPGEFIPVLEETGMMDEVGLWVLNTACRQARAWEDLGLRGLKMAVNLSARQFRDPALNTMIVRTLERHRLEPQSLELELTETATMEDAKHTRQLFGELIELGVSVAIDDFGTGYSSLSYLKNLPFSKLKIDREFVTDVHQRRDSHAICTALVELAHGLDILVLAEGVETREEADTLRALGCSMFQGFFFARPLAAEDFARTVTDPEWLAVLTSPVHRQRASIRRRLVS